jgi:hypothetical protein
MALLTVLAGPAAADPVDAVTTTGSGSLTVCRSWMVYNSCDAHKVSLPSRVSVGDSIKLTFGSNAKTYTFHVVQIRRQGSACTILSDLSGGREDGERLEIASCQPASKPTSDAR